MAQKIFKFHARIKKCHFGNFSGRAGMAVHVLRNPSRDFKKKLSRQYFEFSLKVMGSNPGDNFKSFLPCVLSVYQVQQTFCHTDRIWNFFLCESFFYGSLNFFEPLMNKCIDHNVGPCCKEFYRVHGFLSWLGHLGMYKNQEVALDDFITKISHTKKLSKSAIFKINFSWKLTILQN